MKNNTYPKSEKLKSKKEITLLFQKGKWRTSGNIRIVFFKMETLPHSKISVAVSKRNLKKAVDRNRAKRLMREAYRLNKSVFRQAFDTPVLSMIFWISNQTPQHFSEVEQDFIEVLKKV